MRWRLPCLKSITKLLIGWWCTVKVRSSDVKNLLGSLAQRHTHPAMCSVPPLCIRLDWEVPLPLQLQDMIASLEA